MLIFSATKGHFYKTQWAWHFAKLTWLMLIFTSKKVWNFWYEFSSKEVSPLMTISVNAWLSISFAFRSLRRIGNIFKIIYILFLFRRPSCYRRHHRRCLIMRTTPFLRQQLIGPMAFFPLLPRNYVRYNCFVCEIDLLMCMYAWKTTNNKRKYYARHA